MYIPLVVGAVVFWMVLTLAEKKTDKTYNYTKFIENLETGRVTSPKSGLRQYFQPFIKGTQNRIKLSKNVEEELERKFKEAAFNMTPQQFYTNKIVYPVVFVTLFLVLGVIRDNNIIFFLLAGVSSLTYYYPNYVLNRRLKNAKAMRRLELPNYLTPLGLLLHSYTPYQAVKKSSKFAGPYLKPYVEQLIIEMEMYPSSTRPFRNFAENLGITEAQTFMTALQQAMNTDPGKSREIIQNQIDMMRKLREETYLTLIEVKPLAMQKYNFLTTLLIIGVPLTILVSVFLKVFSTF